MTAAAGGRKRPSAREVLTDTWADNRAAWDDYTAAMAADWSTFVDHEHAAALGVFGHELDALETAIGVTSPAGKRERRHR